jgi:acyl-CoA thioesterase-1
MQDSAMHSLLSPSRRTLLCHLVTLGGLVLAGTSLPLRAGESPPALLVVGDSISAAYGLPPGTGWVDLLSARIAAQKLPYRVVNASISGDTTAGGRARLPALLRTHKPAVVIIELGGNDGLRGGNLTSTRDNLAAMIAAAQKANAKVLVIGMKIPPNYGAAYVREFDALYASVARDAKVPLVPFFFEGFGERTDLFQPDRIHPTVAAQPLLLDNVWPVLLPLLNPRR